MTQKMPELVELEARRQVLAFEVEQGRDGAAQELEAVEQQLAALRRQAERGTLAEQERARRAQADAEAARVAQGAEAEAHLAQKRREQLAAAAKVQEAFGPFREALERYLGAGRAVYAATAALGKTPTDKLRGKTQLQQYVHTALGDVLDVQAPVVSGPRHARQASLVDLLSGDAYRAPSTAASPSTEQAED